MYFHLNIPLLDEGGQKATKPDTHIIQFNELLPTDTLNNLFSDSLNLNIIGPIFLCNSYITPILLQKDINECQCGGILRKDGNKLE